MMGSPGPAEQGTGTSSGQSGLAFFRLTPTGALLAAVLLMEGLWFSLWMVWLGLWGGLRLGEVPLTLGSTLFLLWTSYHTVQILGEQRWSTKKARVVAGCFSVALLALVARLENGGGYALLDLGWLKFAVQGLVGSFPSAMQISLLGGTYLWWRGYRLASGGLHQEQVLHSFMVGLSGTVLGLLAWEAGFWSGVGFEATRQHALAITVAFFVAAVSALALSHLLRVRADIAHLEGVTQPWGNRWSLVVLAVVTGMLVAGVMVSTLLSFDLWSLLLRLLSLVSYAVAFLLYWLMLPLAYLVAYLIYFVRWLLSMRGTTAPPLRLPDFSALRVVPTNEDVPGTPLWVTLVKWVLLLLIAAVVVWLLSRLLLARRRRTVSSEGVVEVHESLGSWRDFWRDLFLGLFLLFFWMRDQGRRVRSRVRLPSLSKYQVPDGDMEVRELYARLLEEARLVGVPRKKEATPFEYLATLKRHLPVHGEALERITADYVLVRYGEQPLHQEEKGLLNQLWRSVIQGLRSLGRIVG